MSSGDLEKQEPLLCWKMIPNQVYKEKEEKWKRITGRHGPKAEGGAVLGFLPHACT